MFSERRAWSIGTAREKQAWPADKVFKILSLDGGGIRGVFASTILRELESRHGPIAGFFDLISGTSTGGIIAIGLGLGIPAQQIDDVYRVDGELIFPPMNSAHPWTRVAKKVRRLFRPAHNHKVLVSALKREFGERPFGDSRARLVVPAFVGPDPQVAVFKTDHHLDYRRDWETPAWKVARATAAAPTFFEAQKDGHAFFLDGGVWANNPILCAVVEAISAYDLSPDQIRVLSIGTGSNAEKLSETRIGTGLVGWIDIIKTAMFLTSDSHLGLAKLLVGADKIVRLDPTLDEISPIELDDWVRACKHLPAAAGLTLESREDEVSMFFERAVEPRERHFT